MQNLVNTFFFIFMVLVKDAGLDSIDYKLKLLHVQLSYFRRFVIHLIKIIYFIRMELDSHILLIQIAYFLISLQITDPLFFEFIFFEHLVFLNIILIGTDVFVSLLLDQIDYQFIQISSLKSIAFVNINDISDLI